MATLYNLVGQSPDDSAVLSFAPSFLAKSESSISSVKVFKSLPLSSLTDQPNELLQCPVRALDVYMRLTDVPRHADKLFVCP